MPVDETHAFDWVEHHQSDIRREGERGIMRAVLECLRLVHHHVVGLIERDLSRIVAAVVWIVLHTSRLSDWRRSHTRSPHSYQRRLIRAKIDQQLLLGGKALPQIDNVAKVRNRSCFLGSSCGLDTSDAIVKRIDTLNHPALLVALTKRSLCGLCISRVRGGSLPNGE